MTTLVTTLVTARRTPAPAVLGAVVLATMSLGLPWGSSRLLDYLTPGYYTPEFCDYGGYCVGGIYVPGYIVPGAELTVSGADSTARVFIVATVALALLGWRLPSSRLLRAAAVVAAAGVVLHLSVGLTSGVLTLGLAGACLWVAARRVGAPTQVSPSAW